MNCHAPIQDVCAQCEVSPIGGIRLQCVECLDVVCLRCIHNKGAHHRDLVCQRCAEDIAAETRTSDTSSNSLLSTVRLAGIVVLALAACTVAIALIARVLDHLLGGAQ